MRSGNPDDAHGGRSGAPRILLDGSLLLQADQTGIGSYTRALAQVLQATGVRVDLLLSGTARPLRACTRESPWPPRCSAVCRNARREYRRWACCGAPASDTVVAWPDIRYRSRAWLSILWSRACRRIARCSTRIRFATMRTWSSRGVACSPRSPSINNSVQCTGPAPCRSPYAGCRTSIRCMIWFHCVSRISGSISADGRRGCMQ